MSFRRRTWNPLHVGVLLGLSLVGPQALAEEPEEEVVVQGHRAPRVGGEKEMASTVIDGEKLRQPGVHATDVLAGAPGVQVHRTGTGADSSTVSIRGLSGAQVPVYVAGMRINDDFVGVADLSRVPLWMMHQVRVHRTAHPSHSARGGLAGAVVFEPTLPRKRQVRGGALVGSFSSGAAWLGASETHGEAAGRQTFGATSVAYRRQGAENDFSYLSDGGTAFDESDDEKLVRQNADALSDDLWVLSRFRFPMASEWARATWVSNFFQREKGVSSLALVPALHAREEVRRILSGVSVALPCGKECVLRGRSHVSFTDLTTKDPEAELRLGAQEVFQGGARVTNQWGVQVRPGADTAAKLSLVYEASRIEKDLSGPDVSAAAARGRESLLAGIVSVSHDWSSELFSRGEVRASCMMASGSEAGAGEPQAEWERCAPEGRVGFTAQVLPPVALRFAVVRGVRFPTLGERFGVSATTRGNIALRVEESWSVDGGTDWEYALGNWGHVTGELSGFARSAQDLVAYRRASQGYVRPYNVADSRFVGGEGATTVSAFGYFEVGTGVSLLRARDVSAERETLVPFRSAVTWMGEVSLSSGKLGEVLEDIGAGAHLDYRSARFADPAGLLKIPEQWVLALTAHLTVGSVNVKTRLSNLFDQARFDTVGFPLPGRAFYVSAEVVVP